MKTSDILEPVFDLRHGEYTLNSLCAVVYGKTFTALERLKLGRLLAQALGKPRNGLRLEKTRRRTVSIYLLLPSEPWDVRRAAMPLRPSKFVIPGGIAFAPGGKGALSKAISSLRKRTEARPAIIVVGPAASGKTRLVAALITHFYGAAAAVPMIASRDDGRLEHKLDCMGAEPVLWLEGAALVYDMPSLNIFLTSQVWKYRPLHHNKLASFPIVPRVFVTSSAVGNALTRRGIVIHLKGGAK